MSGLAIKNPCNAATISLSTLLEREVINVPILEALVQLHMSITLDDIALAINVLSEECSNLFSQLLTQFRKQTEENAGALIQSMELTLSDLLHRSLLVTKPAFSIVLLKQGSKPVRKTIGLLMDDTNLVDDDLINLLAQECTQENRALMLEQALINNRHQIASAVLEGGPMNAEGVNLARVMGSEVLAMDVNYMGRLEKFVINMCYNIVCVCMSVVCM